LPKGMIIPKMKKGIPSTGHFEDMHVGKFKGPPKGGPFLISRPFPAVSRVLRGLREKALERTAGSLNNSRVRGRSR
jgi:hypothetical protein